ncbi:hypothetical protein AJ80_07128 [Polytolypa hystricis UAMH7299]|uniref:Cyclin-D1-binding protein 1-like N-terminal domain-containing protein n=1 Tax=Polytolypa hystricis (strain UAMH7299) TaxID=1447883 RepID=A0A2B7XS76_POLH7|nr:hypothetical protein AJ80_07128 [Polytolypa hystricis UAMH7299]
MAQKLRTTLDATLVLIEQFTNALSSPAQKEQPPRNSGTETNPSPLPLLLAAAQTLKSQTTKLSLLSLNAPFTPSALLTILSAINESILPSLVTGALLCDPEKYTFAFHKEAKVLVKEALTELTTLINDVRGIASEEGKGVDEGVKGVVMTSTGRVWKACDELVTIATDGVVGLVLRKAEEYMKLVADGIRELEEWDPEEDGDDDPFGEDFDDDGVQDHKARDNKNAESDDNDDDEKGEEDEETLAKLQDEKKYLLRLLNPINRIYKSISSPAGLKKLNTTTADDNNSNNNRDLFLSTYASHFDALISKFGEIPDLVDEAAGSLYEHDIDNAVTQTDLLGKLAMGTVQSIRELWVSSMSEQQQQQQHQEGEGEDKFLKWADTWLKVVGEMVKSRSGSS